MLAAIVYVATTGCTWRQLPPVFGPAWQTVHRRFARCSRARVRARLHRVVLDEPGARGDRTVHGDLRADTMVRGHHRGVVLVDWAHATCGPALIDPAPPRPQLVLAGWRNLAAAVDHYRSHPDHALDLIKPTT